MQRLFFGAASRYSRTVWKITRMFASWSACFLSNASILGEILVDGDESDDGKNEA
jgi:hypothetical protein